MTTDGDKQEIVPAKLCQRVAHGIHEDTGNVILSPTGLLPRMGFYVCIYHQDRIIHSRFASPRMFLQFSRLKFYLRKLAGISRIKS